MTVLGFRVNGRGIATPLTNADVEINLLAEKIMQQNPKLSGLIVHVIEEPILDPLEVELLRAILKVDMTTQL